MAAPDRERDASRLFVKEKSFCAIFVAPAKGNDAQPAQKPPFSWE
jgi:hypothetical protein